MKKFVICLLLALAVTGCSSEDPRDLSTPQYTTSTENAQFAPTDEIIHNSADGVKTISPADKPSAAALNLQTPETVWDKDDVITYHAFTLPEKAMLDTESGSMGVLTIPKLGLSVNIYEAASEMEAMDKGVAHFKSTSAYDGNVGLSAHNINMNGSDGYFKDLHTLKIGDEVAYMTAVGERTYKVTTVREISDTDWSYLSRCTDNKVTLITCISGKPTKRLVVQAFQK